MALSQPEPELLEHLVAEFGDHGRRAVSFLSTAQELLASDPQSSPRLGETVAYCLREAMEAILASANDPRSDSGWRDISRGVVESGKQYKLKANLPGGDTEGALSHLLSRIDALEHFHDQESTHQRKLIAVMLDRTGTVPLSTGTQPVKDYQDLLGQLNRGLHEATSIADARYLWLQCLGILRYFFLPPEIRHAELEALAQVGSPSTADAEAVRKLVATPKHLQHFLTKVTDPAWLAVLSKAGILDPPEDQQSPWPALAAVQRLAPDYPDELAAWLKESYGTTSEGSCRRLGNTL